MSSSTTSGREASNASSASRPSCATLTSCAEDLQEHPRLSAASRCRRPPGCAAAPRRPAARGAPATRRPRRATASGSRRVNSLPRPGRRSRLDGAAVHLRPASHQRQPDAEAALRCGRRARPCTNSSKMRGEHARRDADAVVAHGDAAPSPSRRAAPRCPPPLRRVLRGVVQQVGEHLREPHGSPSSHRSRCGRASTVERWPRARISGWPSRARCARRRRADALPAQLDLAAGDARHVEQIVDQPHEVVTCRSITSSGRRLRVAAGEAQQLERVAHRRQRVAQLVRQHRRGTRPCADRPRAAPAPDLGASARRAQQRVHAHEQLARAERLHQVVVGAPRRPSMRASSPARAESRITGMSRSASSARSAPMQPEAVEPRHHHVGQHQIGRPRARAASAASPSAAASTS